MAEATLNDVIKVLKQNDLNDGQDADRQYAKTEAVFDEIAKLNKMLGAHFLKDKAGAGDDLEEKREKREEKAKIQKEVAKGPTTFKEGFMGGSGLGFLQNLASLPMALLTGVLGSKLAAQLLPGFGKILGRTLSRGTLFGALALFGSDLIQKGFEKITGKELDAASADIFTNILNATVLGSIFGRKGAFAGLVYGIVDNVLKKTFPNKDDDESAWQKKVDLLGFELPFTNENFVQFGSALAAFFGPSLILRGIKKSLGMGAASATSTAAKTGFFAGFNPNTTFAKKGVRALGWGALIAMGGSLLGDIIAAQTGSVTTGDLVEAAGGALAIKMLFTGPLGITAGLAYFAFEAGGMLRDYLKERAENAKAEFMAEVEDYAKRMELAQKSDAQLIAMANAAMLESAANQAAGIKPTEEQTLAEQALINETDRRDPTGKNTELLFLAEEIEGLKLEITRLEQMGSPAADDKNNILKQREQEYYNIAGEYYTVALPKLRKQLGMDTGDNNFLPDLPQREDFSRFFLSKRREDYNFKQAMKAYDKAILDLMPPMAASGSGGSTVINAPSVHGGNSATALLSGTGSTVDRVNPHTK